MIREALPQLYERETVLKLDKVLAETLNQNLGGLPENPWFSPQEVIDRELYAIEAVENQQGLFEPIAPEFQAFLDQESRRDQARIITALLQSKDRYNLFRGVAGSGKTSTLQELCRGLRSGGMQAEFRSNTAGRLRLTDQQGWFSDTSIAPGTVVVPIPERSLWVRAELRAEDGSMIALTNPIYIQHPLTTQSLLPE